MQHHKIEDELQPHNIPIIDGSSQKVKKVHPLSSTYTNVPPTALIQKEQVVPPWKTNVHPQLPNTNSKLAKGYEWLEHIRQLIANAELGSDDFISWAAYHASRQMSSPNAITDVALMPLFMECAPSLAMIKHSMNVSKAAVQHLNPGQVSIITMDQPLFALAKSIQWNFPDTHGEDKLVMLFGGLHIEMTAFKMLGDWIEDSCWTNAICTAGIATSGIADSMIKVSHLTRTRHAHQVTAAALFIL